MFIYILISIGWLIQHLHYLVFGLIGCMTSSICAQAHNLYTYTPGEAQESNRQPVKESGCHSQRRGGGMLVHALPDLPEPS